MWNCIYALAIPFNACTQIKTLAYAESQGAHGLIVAQLLFEAACAVPKASQMGHTRMGGCFPTGSSALADSAIVVGPPGPATGEW